MARLVRAKLWIPDKGNSNDARHTNQTKRDICSCKRLWHEMRCCSLERHDTVPDKRFKSSHENNVLHITKKGMSTLSHHHSSSSEHQSDLYELKPRKLAPLELVLTGSGRYFQNGQRSDDRVVGDVVEILIKGGTDIDCHFPIWEETALHLAARYGRTIAAKHLVVAGAKVNARDKTGRTPLHLAVTADAQEVFQILVSHRSTDVNAQCEDGATPLIYAARFLTNNLMEKLITIGASINMADKQGRTALHWAAYVGNEEGTALLLKYNAKKNAQDKNGQTPLFLASKEGSLSVVRILLSSFAHCHLQDDMGQSALDIALERDHIDIVKLFWDDCSSVSTASYIDPLMM